MKTLFAAAAALLATPLMAQTADHSMHAAAPAPAAAAPVTARLSLDTPLAEIVADEAGKAVIEADLPGATQDEHYEMVKSMSLRQIARMAPQRLPDELLAKVEADLARIK